jgi:hypothetical protein
VAGPDQDFIVLIDGMWLRLDDLVFQVCQNVIVQIKLSLQRTIGDRPPSQAARVGQLAARETYMRVKGAWKYLYCAVDKHGQTVDVLLTAHRDTQDASAHQNVPSNPSSWYPKTYGRLF